MKKVCALVGSLRAESYNRAIFNQYSEVSKGAFHLKEGEIKDIPLFNQDIDKEPPAVAKLAQQIHSSDALLFFSPEYNYSIPGVLKNAIDWLSRSELRPFDHKPAAIIGVTVGNLGTVRMQYHLRQVGVFLNLHFLNRPEVMIGQAAEKIKEGRLNDLSTLEFITKHVGKFDEFIKTF